MNQVSRLPQVEISRTFDASVVEKIIKTPELYELIREDGSPSPDEIDLTTFVHNRENYCLIARVDGDIAGVVIFSPNDFRDRSLEAHLNVLPAFWGGSVAKNIARRAVKWVFDETSVSSVVAKIPVRHQFEPSVRVARSIGMWTWKTLFGTFSINGERFDERLYVVDRGGLKAGG